MEGFRLCLRLGQMDFQYAVLEFCRGLGIINTGNVEGTGHLAVAALPTQIVTCLVLLVIVFLYMVVKWRRKKSKICNRNSSGDDSARRCFTVLICNVREEMKQI